MFNTETRYGNLLNCFTLGREPVLRETSRFVTFAENPSLPNFSSTFTTILILVTSCLLNQKLKTLKLLDRKCQYVNLSENYLGGCKSWV